MNFKKSSVCLIVIITLVLIQIEARQTQDKGTRAHRALVSPPRGAVAESSSTVSSLLDRIRGLSEKSDTKRDAATNIDDHSEDEEEIDSEEGEEDEFENDEADDGPTTAIQPQENRTGMRAWTDMFGNQLKVDENRTTLVIQNKARDLGLLTLKAIILGPLIGLTIKAALIRGLLWAIGAYLLHLFFPTLLSTLGLGTGLVGFARQMQPSFAEMVLPQLANFTMCAIDRSQGITN